MLKYINLEHPFFHNVILTPYFMNFYFLKSPFPKAKSSTLSKITLKVDLEHHMVLCKHSRNLLTSQNFPHAFSVPHDFDMQNL